MSGVNLDPWSLFSRSSANSISSRSYPGPMISEPEDMSWEDYPGGF